MNYCLFDWLDDMFTICLTKGKEILLMVSTDDPDDGSILRDERRTDSASPFLLNHPKVWDEESEDETTAVHPAVSESEPTLAYGNITSRYIPALNQYVTTWFLSYDIIPIVCPRAWKGFGWGNCSFIKSVLCSDELLLCLMNISPVLASLCMSSVIHKHHSVFLSLMGNRKSYAKVIRNGSAWSTSLCYF